MRVASLYTWFTFAILGLLSCKQGVEVSGNSQAITASDSTKTLLSVLAPVAAPPLGNPKFGVNTFHEDPPWNIDLDRQTGFAAVRLNAYWKFLETSHGVFTWTALDASIARAQQQHLAVTLVLFGVPDWAGNASLVEPRCATLPSDPMNRPQATPPANGYFGDFARALAQRYGTQIDAWEIWHEVETCDQWRGTPQAYQSQVLVPGVTQIRSVLPSAFIIAPGSSISSWGGTSTCSINCQLQRMLDYVTVQSTTTPGTRVLAQPINAFAVHFYDVKNSVVNVLLPTLNSAASWATFCSSCSSCAGTGSSSPISCNPCPTCPSPFWLTEFGYGLHQRAGAADNFNTTCSSAAIPGCGSPPLSFTISCTPGPDLVSVMEACRNTTNCQRAFVYDSRRANTCDTDFPLFNDDSSPRAAQRCVKSYLTSGSITCP